jgi:hypothetical protein
MLSMAWLTPTEMPDLADPIWFSSKGGSFVAGSSDPAALRRLADAYTPFS